MLYLDCSGGSPEMGRNKRVTVNHDEIRGWVERYSGVPEIVDDPAAKNDRKAIRIDFPGDYDDLVSSRLRRKTNWDEFFLMFDQLEYAFVYDDPLRADQRPSDGFHFIRRDQAGRELFD